MKTIIPYIKEDNSCNLPYAVSVDEFGCDVISFNDKVIPLNKQKSNINYQLTIYKYCRDEYEYSAYQIIENVYIIIQYKNYKKNIQGLFKVIDHDKEINLSPFINDDTSIYSVSYNDKYIVLLKSNLNYYDKEIVEAYDIDNKKMIDCSNQANVHALMTKIVNKRRCSLNIILSILKGTLTNDKSRLFAFLSFLNNCEINENNYYDYLDVSKKYILKLYPELCNYDNEYLSYHNSRYNYLYFSPIGSVIDNLKYKDEHIKIKKK